MATAVRNIRRYEAAVRAARKDQSKSSDGQTLPPSMHSATDGRGRLADGSAIGCAGFHDAGEKGWGGDGDEGGFYGGTVHLRECPRVCGLEGASSPLEVSYDWVVCRTPDILSCFLQHTWHSLYLLQN